jgi:hypothetical protein
LWVPLRHDRKNGFFRAHLRRFERFHEQIRLDLMHLSNALLTAAKEAASCHHIRWTLCKIFQSGPLKAVDFVAAILGKADEPEMVETLEKLFSDLNLVGLHGIGNAAIDPEKSVGIKGIQYRSILQKLHFRHDHGILQFEFGLRAVLEPTCVILPIWRKP